MFLLLLVSAQVSAGRVDKTEKLEQTRTRIRQVERSLQHNKAEGKALVKQLEDIEKQYGSLSTSLKRLSGRINQSRTELGRLRKAIKAQQRDVLEQSRGLSGQIRSAYAMGRQERLKLVLNQQDPSRSNRLLIYYSYLNNARLERLEVLNQSVQSLSENEQQQAATQANLEALVASSEIERQALRLASIDRRQLLKQLNADVESQSKVLVQLRNSELELARILRQHQQNVTHKRISEKPFADLKGRLDWPVAGKIKQRFGSRRANSRWDGVLIAAKEGTVIKSVSSGRVIFSDWLRGYGLLTIVDHGGGYMTLYAFARSLEKNVGDQVGVGEIIASVGKSDGRNQAGLYFGIRKLGKPVNPVIWCKKVKGGRVS